MSGVNWSIALGGLNYLWNALISCMILFLVYREIKRDIKHRKTALEERK